VRPTTMQRRYIGQPAVTGSRHALQHCTLRSAPRPLNNNNNVLPPSSPGVKRRRTQRNARNKWPTTWLESVGGHGPCQTRGVSQTPRGCANPDYGAARRRIPYARGHPATRPSAASKPLHTDAGRCTTPKIHATHRNPLRRRPGRPPPPRRLYRFR